MTGLTSKQRDTLARPLNRSRVASRSGGGGKQLSYLEAWDVRAHLIRVFGYGNFDAEVLTAELVFQRDKPIGQDQKPGWEVAWKVVLQLTLRSPNGAHFATYTEAAIGSADGATGLGDLHDNAVKQAASDALKRCAINLGNQFGLSLYDNGSTRDVVMGTLLDPPKEVTEEQEQNIIHSLGATVIKDGEQPPVAPEPEQVVS